MPINAPPRDPHPPSGEPARELRQADPDQGFRGIGSAQWLRTAPRGGARHE
jgi:hypothetical protein